MEKGNLAKMISIASQAFESIFDKAGQPYILHCLKVMEYLHTTDEDLQCIAIGHDLVEDRTEWLAAHPAYAHWFTDDKGTVGHWRSYFRIHGFSERVIDGILALTKIPGESYIEYKAKVKSNPDAIKVKMCDLRHNSDIRRLKGVTQKDIERTIKYQEFYTELSFLVSEK